MGNEQINVVERVCVHVCERARARQSENIHYQIITHQNRHDISNAKYIKKK